MADAADAVTDREFTALRRIIHDETGIWLSDSKRVLLVSRLSKRLRSLGLRSFSEYEAHLAKHDPLGHERVEMINCITTNKTDFFREPHHFEFLKEILLPELCARKRGEIHLWSAGCSTGEEPWSIAMAAVECLGADARRRVRILASDIDTQVLARAEQGLYPRERLDPVAAAHWQPYCLQGKGGHAGLVRIRPEIVRMVTFRRINLNDGGWPFRGRFDAIFCRNVIIYFDHGTQLRLLRRFADHLDVGGHLFLGHAETICERIGDLAPIGNSIYRRPTPAVAHVRGEGHLQLAIATSTAAAAVPEPDRVRINAGELHAAAKPTVVSTLLGSCVAACLFDPHARIGGMNHFMLPEGVARDRFPNRLDCTLWRC